MPKGFNPFNPNSVVVPTLFAGRTDTVLEICKKLSQLKHSMPSSFFIFGERGIGKTALAKLIMSVATLKDEKLYELNLLTSYYAVEKNQDLSSVLQSSLNALTDSMDKTLVDEIGGRLGELFKNGKFKIGAFGTSLEISSNSESEEARNITVKDQTVSILTNIIQAISKEESKDGVLIVIDEIHNLKNLNQAASILRNIVTTLDVSSQGKLAFLLIGYEEDVTKFFSEDSSARRTFDLHKLSVMPDSEAEEILTKGFEAAGYKWDSDSLKVNIKAAGGYPHSIQVLGHNVIETDTDSLIDAKDWSQATLNTSQILRTKEFAKMYSFDKRLTEKDKILIELARSSGPLSRQDVASRSTSKNIYKQIIALKQSGAIKENEDKTFSLHSQLFRTAILFDIFYREAKERFGTP